MILGILIVIHFRGAWRSIVSFKDRDSDTLCLSIFSFGNERLLLLRRRNPWLDWMRVAINSC